VTSAIYKAGWNKCNSRDGTLFRQHVASKFLKTPETRTTLTINQPNTQQTSPLPRAKVSKIPPPLPPHLVLSIWKKVVEKINRENKQKKKSFTQVTKVRANSLLKL